MWAFFNEAMRSPNLKTSFGFALGSLYRLVQKVEFGQMDQKEQVWDKFVGFLEQN